MLRTAPDKLRADLQRFYGLDMDELGHSVRVRRAADLAAHLPDEACIWTAFDPRAEWDATRQLLANIADNTSFLAWCQTKDATRRGATWKNRVPRPGGECAKERGGHAANVDDVRTLLSMPRT